MATIKEDPHAYKVRGIQKRDFQHTHDGPEEMPHRPKGTGKKFCKKHKGPHVFDTFTEWSTYGTWRYRYKACVCGRRGFGFDGSYQSQRLVESTIIVDGVPQTRKFWG